MFIHGEVKTKIYFAILLFLSLTPYKADSQLVVTQGVAMGMTPMQLIQTQLIGTGITVLNATYNGSSALISSDQIGYFSTSGTATTQLGLTAGILMTCGKANIAIGPNNSAGASYTVPGGRKASDDDLSIMAGDSTHDKCVLEFDFIPQADTLRFRYVFGSEEFYEFCYEFNDDFGFFLSGPGIAGTFSNNSVNIALMPASTNYVTINNLCSDPTSNWINPTGSANFQYDGMSYVFTATYILTPCLTYHIKLAVADALDQALDSGVFLEKNSFTTSAVSVDNTYMHPEIAPGAIEGCSDALVSFHLPSPAASNYVIHFSIGGTATMGVDYAAIADSVIVPTGQITASTLIHPFTDNQPEGIETVILTVLGSSCGGSNSIDTISIYDNTTLIVTGSNDTSVCLGSTIVLNALASGGLAGYQYTWNTGNTQQSISVTPPLGSYAYTVTVTDACGASASDNIVASVYQPPMITNNPTIFTYCSVAAVYIPLTSSLPGSTFHWTASCKSADVSGYSDGSGNTISQTLINSGVTRDTVIYLVTAVNGICIGQPVPLQVIVIPPPSAYALPDVQEFCSGNTTSLSLHSDNPGATFSWTVTPGSPNVTGASGGSGTLISQTLHNSGNLGDSAVYHVTPTDNGCTGAVTDVTVYVNPLPVVTLIPCTDSKTTSNAKSFPLKGGRPLGGTYSGPGVLPPGVFSPFSAGPGIKNIHYSYTNAYGCISSATMAISVANPPGFFCGNPFTDIRDNKQYPTIQIGAQCWFAANLNYGNSILAGVMQTDNCLAEKYCRQDIPGNCTLEGALYQWDEMMQYNDAPAVQGFCPPAWHIPTEADWSLLFSAFTSNGYAGSPLKVTGYSGFNAMLSGTRFENSNWYFSTFATMLWSSGKDGPLKAWAHGMNSINPSVSYYPGFRSNAFSVRCIKD
jgi:uncharacterized protein (TIGR02145 family)